MKENKAFEEFKETLGERERELVEEFFSEFKLHVLLPKREKRAMREDFERAILYYSNTGVPLDDALSRLDIKNLGGFYARPPLLWYPLDDAAKIYPLSMEHGRMSLFRLSVYFKEDVVPELLQIALSFAIKRFPSFATTLKKGFFWHYLDTSKRRYCAEEERGIPCRPLPVSKSGSPAFRVMYYQNRMSVEFFHILTDGMGGLTFLKVLAAEYLRLRGVRAGVHPSVWNVNDVPSAEEFANEFSRMEKTETASGFVDKTATQMSGSLTSRKPARIIHFKLCADALKVAAAKHGCTVTAYVLALMFIAGKGATDELTGDINIQVPVNMRKFYPSSTVRNFSMYCGVRLELQEIEDVGSITGKITEQLTAKASKQAMSEMLTATEQIVNMIAYVPLVIKHPVAKLVYGFLGDKVFSNTLSNLGVVKLPPELEEHIESMDFVLGTAISNRASCAMVTIGNTTTLSVTKMTVDPSFEEKLFDLLSQDGMDVQVEGSGCYEG